MLRLLPLAVLFSLSVPASAQSLPEWASPSTQATPPTGPGDNPGTPGPAPPQSVPIDGGLGLLALAGGAYAVRRLRSEG